MNSIIECRNVTKTFGNGYTVLNDISLSITKGEFVAIIGLSGSGKTTLIKTLNKFNEISSGEILFENKSIVKLSASETNKLRKKVGMIFQSFNLINRFTVLQNVLIGALSELGFFRTLLCLYKPEHFLLAEKCINKVGLAEKLHSKVSQLSGGQQQRVAIARTLMQNPQIIMADEPVASLDPKTAVDVMNYLKELNTNDAITIISNLHSIELVRAYASRVIALQAGKIVFNDKTDLLTDELLKKIYGEKGITDVQ